MSSLLRPVGHLPASVYWFRRGLVLAVVVVLLVVLIKVVGGGNDQKNSAATDPGQNPSSGQTVVPTSTPTTTPNPKSTKKTSETVQTSETPKDLKCGGNDVTIDLVLANRSLATGASMNMVVQLSAIDDECKATVDASRLSVTITSGNDLIWTSQQCEKVIQKAVLVLAKGKQSTTTVPWDGRRSRPGCLPGQLQAKPGTYVAKAVYDGRSSASQAFQIT